MPSFGRNPQQADKDRKHKGHAMPGPIPLSYFGVYRCPVCRYGEMSALVMMEAFGCNFCDRIFTANLEQNSLELPESMPPLRWYWNGFRWQGAHRPGVELGWGIAIAAIAMVILPPILVGLAAYIFPPVPGSSLSWLPGFWTVSAFFAHLSIAVWLILEYYQFPVRAFLRAWRRYLLRQT